MLHTKSPARENVEVRKTCMLVPRADQQMVCHQLGVWSLAQARWTCSFRRMLPSLCGMGTTWEFLPKGVPHRHKKPWKQSKVLRQDHRFLLFLHPLNLVVEPLPVICCQALGSGLASQRSRLRRKCSTL